MRREWCCNTLVSEPHRPGCEFEPRGPLDYDGPVEIRAAIHTEGQQT